MTAYFAAGIELSMVCKLIGHKFQDTVVIRKDGDFEVNDARYCRQCGTVHAEQLAS